VGISPFLTSFPNPYSNPRKMASYNPGMGFHSREQPIALDLDGLWAVLGVGSQHLFQRMGEYCKSFL
jgi:hypothetical protein